MLTSLSGMRVLVVEDDADLGALTTAVLQEEGALVHWAPTGDEALRALSAFAPDLVLVDSRLPDMSGASLSDRVRDESSCAQILVSGDVEEMQRWSDRGRPGLLKPFDFSDLIHLVRRVGVQREALAAYL